MKKSTEPGRLGYYPEMGEPKPEADMEASMAHYGRHWYLHTPIELRKGVGIRFIGVTEESHLVPAARHKAGWRNYKVTDRAFDILCKQYRISHEMLLS